jgi:hypothetical protein
MYPVMFHVVLDATRPVSIATGQEAVTDMTNKGNLSSLNLS